MNLYCPFCNKDCISTKCIMWENGCLIISFLYRSNENSKKISLEEITNKTTEELAEELFQFALNEIKELPDIDIYDISELFWLNKNVVKFSLSNDLKAKIKKVELIVKDKLESFRNKDKKEFIRPQTQMGTNGKSLEEITNKTTEELAEELFQFALNEIKELPDIDIYDISELFWLNKNVVKFSLSNDLKAKIKKVELIVKDKLEEYENKYEKNDKADLKDLTSEELAEDIFLLWKNESGNQELSRDTIYTLFWKSRGINQWTSDINESLKIAKAQKLVDEKIFLSKLPFDIKTVPPEKIIGFAYDFGKIKYQGMSNMGCDDIVRGYISSFLSYSIVYKLPNIQEKIRLVMEMAKSIILEIENPEVELLIESFYSWSINNGFKRITLADADVFLLSNKRFLSKESKRILCAKTNIKLKSC